MAVKQPDSDEYRGCWNCIFHDDSDGFVITCLWNKENNSSVYLRCPAWVNKEDNNGSNN
jgi:hypothetical protein